VQDCPRHHLRFGIRGEAKCAPLCDDYPFILSRLGLRGLYPLIITSDGWR
jgi:hypothetical protein